MLGFSDNSDCSVTIRNGRFVSANEYTKDHYLNCGETYEDTIDHSSSRYRTSTPAVEKNEILDGYRTSAPAVPHSRSRKK